MENPTPFDLNQAIQCWRENLAQSPAFRNENLNELEAHLRDSVATMQTCGLSTEETFIIAAKRIGKDGVLENEYAKVNTRTVWMDRVLWMLIGIQLWGFVSGTASLFTRSGLSFGWKVLKHDFPRNFGLGDVVLPVAIYALVNVATLATGLTFSWWLIRRKGRRLGGWFQLSFDRRRTFLAAGAGLCLVSLVAHALSCSSNMIMAANLGPEAFAANSFYFTYAQILILWPIQIVTMMAVTLVLARKRLRPCND